MLYLSLHFFDTLSKNVTPTKLPVMNGHYIFSIDLKTERYLTDGFLPPVYSPQP